MPRAGLSQELVMREAATLIDEQGPESLTLAALAARLTVRPPSLYKHVNGLPAVHRGIALHAKRELADTLGNAAVGLARGDAITALAIAYRRWALAHPGQYPSTLRAPEPSDGEDVAASSALLKVVRIALGAYALTGDEATDAVRMLRATLHGYVSLEVTGGFELPRDREQSYRWLVQGLIAALEAKANEAV
jgi:AcrR family transcriptional regulator